MKWQRKGYQGWSSGLCTESPFYSWIRPLFHMTIDPEWSRWIRVHVAVQLGTGKMEPPRADGYMVAAIIFCHKKLQINLVKKNFRSYNIYFQLYIWLYGN
jgi:hypothetical protein